MKPHPEAVEAARREFYDHGRPMADVVTAALAAHFERVRWVECPDHFGREPMSGCCRTRIIDGQCARCSRPVPACRYGCGVNAPAGWRMEVGE